MPRLATSCEDTPSPVAQGTIRRVRAPAVRPTARTPHVTSCLLGDGCRMRRPRCLTRMSTREILRKMKPSHARTLAMHLLKRFDAKWIGVPSCAALRYIKCEAVFTVDNFLVMKRRSPRPSTSSPRRPPPYSSQYERYSQLLPVRRCRLRPPSLANARYRPRLASLARLVRRLTENGMCTRGLCGQGVAPPCARGACSSYLRSTCHRARPAAASRWRSARPRRCRARGRPVRAGQPVATALASFSCCGGRCGLRVGAFASCALRCA